MIDGFSQSESFEGNPLQSGSPEVWDRLVRGLGPASMIVCIRSRMGPRLQARVAPEDIWQETLLHVWRDRERCDWQGMRAFRRWVLRVADHRIHDAADREGATKRGAGVIHERLDPLESHLEGPPVVASTTPSQVASDGEHATLMQAALAALHDDVREVVRLRLFEELPVEDVASRLDLGVSAVKHRFRKGAALYHRQLERLLSDRTRRGA